MSRNLTTDEAMRMQQPSSGRRIAYGTNSNLFGELRMPSGSGPFALAIVIHGGCWKAQYDLAYMGNLCAALTAAGLAAWSIEYRRVGNAGGGWPGTLQDVAKAADFVRDLARQHPLDLERVIAIGHSAGGHLALWLAARHRLAPDSELHADSPIQLQGVVSLAGIPDLARAGRDGVCGDMAYQLLGGTPEQVPERYGQASPSELLPLGANQVLIHGDADQHVPASMSEQFAAEARRAGDFAEFICIRGAGHFELTDPACAAGRIVVNSIVAATA